MVFTEQWHYYALAGGALVLAIIMWAAFGRKQLAVGIDVGNSHIKIVEIERGKQIKLRRYAILPTPVGAVQNGLVQDPALLEQALKKIMDENNFYRRRVSTALTGQNLMIRTVELPSMPKAEIRDAVKWQFDQHFQLRSEDTVSDYQVIHGEPGQPLSVMLVAMQKEPVVTMLNILRAVGLNTTVVDIEPLAVLRVLQLACDMDKDGTVVVLDFGAGTTNMSIFRGGILRAARVMHFGGRNFTHDLMDEYGWSFEKAEQEKVRYGLRLDSPIADVMTPARDQLFTEISRTINFYFAENRGETLTKVFMLGGGSLIVGLKPQLENYFHDSVSAIGDTFDISLCNPLVEQKIILPTRKMPVDMPKAPIEKKEPSSELTPRTLMRMQKLAPEPVYDPISIGVTLSIALGLALGEVLKHAD